MATAMMLTRKEVTDLILYLFNMSLFNTVVKILQVLFIKLFQILPTFGTTSHHVAKLVVLVQASLLVKHFIAK
jgi:hypothetical protein